MYLRFSFTSLSDLTNHFFTFIATNIAHIYAAFLFYLLIALAAVFCALVVPPGKLHIVATLKQIFAFKQYFWQFFSQTVEVPANHFFSDRKTCSKCFLQIAPLQLDSPRAALIHLAKLVCLVLAFTTAVFLIQCLIYALYMIVVRRAQKHWRNTTVTFSWSELFGDLNSGFTGVNWYTQVYVGLISLWYHDLDTTYKLREFTIYQFPVFGANH